MISPILLTGGSGRLGRAIMAAQQQRIVAPARTELDVTSYESVLNAMRHWRPDVVIHCAAVVGRKECDKDPVKAELVNVAGTRNITLACRNIGTKLVLISTAAVFDGLSGNYTETDSPNPKYFYAMTKLEAERIAATTANHLIIRTDFFDPEGFKYEAVFADHFCSKEPSPTIARKILVAIKKGMIGILHISGQRMTLFEVLRPYFSNIKPISIIESTMPDFPRDLSLSSNQFNKEHNVCEY